MGAVGEVVRDRLFLLLMVTGWPLTLLTCISWGAPLNVWTLGVFPISVCFIFTFIVRATSSAGGKLYMGSSGKPKTDAEAAGEFEAAQARQNAARCVRQGLHGEAAAHLRRLLEIEPGDLEARDLLARLCMEKLGLPDEARQQYRDLCRLAPPASRMREDAVSALKAIARARPGEQEAGEV